MLLHDHQPERSCPRRVACLLCCFRTCNRSSELPDIHRQHRNCYAIVHVWESKISTNPHHDNATTGVMCRSPRIGNPRTNQTRNGFPHVFGHLQFGQQGFTGVYRKLNEKILRLRQQPCGNNTKIQKSQHLLKMTPPKSEKKIPK